MENTNEALIKGLTSNPKYIPAWFMYDKEGSRLNALCIEHSEDYYFHRCEVELLKDIVENKNVFDVYKSLYLNSETSLNRTLNNPEI